MKRSDALFFAFITLALMAGVIGYGVGALTTPTQVRYTYLECTTRDIQTNVPVSITEMSGRTNLRWED